MRQRSGDLSATTSAIRPRRPPQRLRMPATVIAERIGWTRSIRVLSGRVAELRPVYLPPDPASRTEYVAGGDRPV